MVVIYDAIGKKYALGRRTDPEIAEQINSKLARADSVLNVGAGTGSYEPEDIPVIAVEPSIEMIQQRGRRSAPVRQAKAENLPFKDASFSHSMTVLSMHHWEDRTRAFQEIRRVTRERFVAVSWDPNSTPFWLTRDYFPEIHELDARIFPRLSELHQSFPKIEVSKLEIPADCIDGFLGAYWRRPEAYLNDMVRVNMSTFSRISKLNEGVVKLRNDLESGEWALRNSDLLERDFFDAGYRIICADLA